MQIFHPIFWVNDQGSHPAGGQTIITLEDVQRGTWRVNPALAPVLAHGDCDWLERYAEYYVQVLTERGKYPLMVWPYHALLGGIAHALVAAVQEAVFFHSVARSSQTRYELKGAHPLTEHYSALQPEVQVDPNGNSLVRLNHELVDTLLGFDRLIIAGQAKSHCVAWTLEDLLTEARARDEALVRKFYLLEDCTSPVVVPGGPDFSEAAEQAFQRFAAAGMHRVRSTEPMASWPEMV